VLLCVAVRLGRSREWVMVVAESGSQVATSTESGSRRDCVRRQARAAVMERE